MRRTSDKRSGTGGGIGRTKDGATAQRLKSPAGAARSDHKAKNGPRELKAVRLPTVPQHNEPSEEVGAELSAKVKKDWAGRACSKAPFGR